MQHTQFCDLKMLIKLYMDNPDYKLEHDEFISNIVHSMGLIGRGINIIAENIEILNTRNDINDLNHQDIKDGRIPYEDYIKRHDDDIEKIREKARCIDGTAREIFPGIELINLLIDKVAKGQIEWGSNSPHSTYKEEYPCSRNCKFCAEVEENFDKKNKYCLETCVWCNNLRKSSVRRQGHPERNMAIAIQSRNPPIISDSKCGAHSPDTISQLLMTNDTMSTNDKYFDVVLTSSIEDGPSDYVSEILTRNFMHMFPPSYRAKAWAYTIYNAENNIPHLVGIIRYDENNKYRITPKSTHIKNDVVSKYTGKKNRREYMINNMTKYEDKRYKTSRIAVIERYSQISKIGRIIGDGMEKFL